MKEYSFRLASRVTRRAFLGGAASFGAAVAARHGAYAQPMQTHSPPGVAPKPKGPLVYLTYDQEELDAAYDQGPWAPNQSELAKRNAQKSAAAIAHLGAPRRLRYGPTPIEQVDLYATRKRNVPVHIFIHGGAWRAGTAAAAAYQAEMFVDAGAHFVAVEFNNVLETNGDLLTMAQQVRRAVAWVYQNAGDFGGDRNRLYVSGQSSGGHLAAVVLTTDWRTEFGLPMNVVKGALCLSGIYDLYPVSLSARSRYVTFTNAVIEALSPLRHLNRVSAPVIVAHGTLETPEFQRQNREFAAALMAAGKSVEFIVLEGYNHFEALESLGNPYGVLGRAVLRQMNLRVA